MSKTQEIAIQPRKFVTALPTIEDLYQMTVPQDDNVNALNVLLDKPPHKDWVKVHPFIKKKVETPSGPVNVGIDYLPIGRVEWLLKRIFKRYRIEVLREGTSFNGVYVVVRVHYLHPILGTMEFHDGIGAQQLQTKKDSSPADLANINNGAISMAFGIAKSIAIKDACDHFGRLFGSDLNRAENIALPDVPRLTRDEERLVNLINLCTSKDQVEALKGQVDLHENVLPYYQEKYDSFI